MTALYAITLFVNAALLFILEPMVAKMLLPFLGGSPAVWIASLVFYQICLLLGYAYAHFASVWLGTRRHALLHMGLVVVAFAALPVALPTELLAAPSGNPAYLVFSALTLSIGVPFLVIAAGAPLVQKWFTEARRSGAQDPYFLYAASNAGSLIGLLAYPLLIERYFSLSQQNRLWLYGYFGLTLMLSACMVYYLRSPRGHGEPTPATAAPVFAAAQEDASRRAAIDWPRRFRWLVWSLVPSSLLSGVTSYITTDVVAAPLLWVVPLSAYLISFILVFGSASWSTSRFVIARQPFLLCAAVLTVAVNATAPTFIILPLHLLAFFVTAMVCHGRLALDRPVPVRLTEFYLWIALGGVLGGLINALVAPLVFDHTLEYPLMMAVAAFARPPAAASDAPAVSARDLFAPLLFGVVMIAVVEGAKLWPILSRQQLHVAVFGTCGIACLYFSKRPVRFGLALVLVLATAARFPAAFGSDIFRGRSFFGVYRVTHDNTAQRHLLFHGTTIHGSQNLTSPQKLQPLSYYHRTGPSGQVLTLTAQQRPNAMIGVIGLGTGALVCHCVRGQRFTFFEIDPLVEAIARDPRLFTFLRDCPPASDVVLGDARLSLENIAEGHFDVLVLDAFSSDAIPLHLLTREAIQVYLRKTSNNGLLLFHISNRHMDLAPVLDRLTQELRLTALIQNDHEVGAALAVEGKTPSHWILASRDRRALDVFRADPRWQHLNGSLNGDLWTDEFTDLLKVIRWR